MVIVLDSGVLGKVVHKNSAPREEVIKYLKEHPSATVVVPEICDYEVRRALLKIRSGKSIQRLDGLSSVFIFHAINSDHMRRAAEIWAQCRQIGLPFCDDQRLDGDCILIAQAEAFAPDVLVVTTNAKDIGRFLAVEVLP